MDDRSKLVKPATAKLPENDPDIHVMPEEFRGAPVAKGKEEMPVVPASKPVLPPPVTVVKPEPVVVPVKSLVPMKGIAGLMKKKWFLPVVIGGGVVLLGGISVLVWLLTRPAPVVVPVTICGNTLCEAGETADSCSLDCAPPAVCGDAICTLSESVDSCLEDCRATACGNAICEAFEDVTSCASDCAPLAPVAGRDSDNDGLTDVEETVIYGSNAQDTDTDRDTFVDLNEVLNLFDPILPPPNQLQNNPGFSVYTNVDFGFSMIVPRVWAVGVDTTTREVTFTGATGDSVVVKVVDKDVGETFEQWFARTYTNGTVTTQVTKTKYGYSVLGTDRMHNWVEVDGKVFGVRYVSVSPTIEYNVTYQMMLMSINK
jgi:hypothetical protein